MTVFTLTVFFLSFFAGLALLIVVLSIVIASTQDSGVHGYVHGDL